MNSQEYDKCISILRHSQARDQWNTPVPGSDQWLPITTGTIWANIKHLSGTEAVKANADVATVRASIRIQWRTGVDEGMVVQHHAQRYKILAVLPAAHRQHVDLVCELVKGR